MRLTQDNYACGIFVDLKKAFDTKWHRGVVVINTPQLHSTKPKPRFYAGSKPACRRFETTRISVNGSGWKNG